MGAGDRGSRCREGQGAVKSFADGCEDLSGVKRCLGSTSYKPDKRGNGKSQRLCTSSKTRPLAKVSPQRGSSPRTVSLLKPINRLRKKHLYNPLQKIKLETAYSKGFL